MYDQNLSLPMIHAALAANPDLKLFGSPWSPPAWMKDNNDMLWGGSLLEEAKSAWAQYFAKWITAYEAQGVPVWGVTVQNEVCGWGVDYDHLYICKLLQKTSDDS